VIRHGPIGAWTSSRGGCDRSDPPNSGLSSKAASIPPETRATIAEAKAARGTYRQAKAAHDQRVKAATEHLANLESRTGRKLKVRSGVTVYERWIETPQGSGSIIGVQATAVAAPAPSTPGAGSGEAYIQIAGLGFSGQARISAADATKAYQAASSFAGEITRIANAAQVAEAGRPAAIEAARAALAEAEDRRGVDAAWAAYSEALAAVPEEYQAVITDTEVSQVAGRAWRTFRQWPVWEQAATAAWAVLFVVLLGTVLARPHDGTTETVSASGPTTTQRTASTLPVVTTTAELPMTTRIPATTQVPATQPATTSEPVTTQPPTTQRPAPSDPFPPKSPRDVGALGVAAPKLATDVRRETVGLPSCPQLRIRAVLPTGLSDRDLTAALARIYLDARFDLGCGGVIFAYADKSEYGDFFTVGRLDIEGSDRRRLGGTGPGHFKIDGGSAVASHVIAEFDF